MKVKTNIQKAIDQSIGYVDSLKTYTKAASEIDKLIKAVLIFEKATDVIISELEMTIQEFNFNFEKHDFLINENIRLKRILALYDADSTLTNDEIAFLEEAKEPSQFYTGSTPREIITQYLVIDAFLRKFDPKKNTRPKNIEQIQKGFNLIIEKYANKN